MTELSSSQLKRLTAVHGWSGVLLGLLLYAVVVTGTVVVFADEIREWSVGGQRIEQPLSGPIDRPVKAVMEVVTKGYREDVSIFRDARGDLLVFPHAHVRHPETGEQEDFGPLFHIDPSSGEVLGRHRGFVFLNPAWYERSALRHFLVDLHVQLYVPEPWGLLLTGILGLATMAAGLTGVIMHRHLIRDLFVPERPGRRLVSFRDRHVLAASWALPFAFLLGFTGAYFSFAGTVLFPLLSDVAFGGDEERMEATLFEPKVVPNPAPASVANLDRIVADAEARYDSPVSFVLVHRYGRADAIVRIFQPPAAGGLQFRRSVYDGVTGTFREERPVVGNTPSAASFAFGMMNPLHFGDFAGVLSKAVWVGLGAAMAFVVVSGMRLWIRRREAQPLWRRFARAVTVVAWGLPLAMLGSAWAYFLSLPAADPFWWTPAGFVIAALACILAGFAMPDEAQLVRLFRRAVAIGCIGLPLLRLIAGGTGWASAIANGYGAVLSIDLLFLAGGAALLIRDRRARAAQLSAHTATEPAE